ncbi:hypothetical protein [Streptomyces sp. NPDC057238]|uniref:hypothetical protein n=1 Tax=Streptomyces sp. NPDC057238 TaxID=3346060 RepID=UPI003639DA15
MASVPNSQSVVLEEGVEIDLDALFKAAKGELVQKKDETKAARGRVRQVARQRRRSRIRKTAEKASAVGPRVIVYGLILAGFTAFGMAVTFLATGNLAAFIATITVAGASWGLAAALHR